MNEALLQKFMSGKATADEELEVLGWIEKENPGWLDDFLNREWSAGNYRSDAREREEFIHSIRERLSIEQAGWPMPDRPKWAKIRRMTAIWTVAASLLLAAGIWTWFKVTPGAVKPAGEVVISNTAPGKILVTRLPDGSTVALNGQSTLRYPADYNQATREVKLNGEAFFEVSHDSSRPFIVRSGHLYTRVYGTSFNVSGDTTNEEYRVSLQKGAVGFGDELNRSAGRLIHPGNMLIYNSASGRTIVQDQPVADMGAWMDGKVIFLNATIKDALSDLGKKYSVHFIIDRSLKPRTITASFDKVPLDNILKHIQYLWQVKFDKKQDTIYVR